MDQCEYAKIEFIDKMPELNENSFNFIVDSIFGYSFKGDIRASFDAIIKVYHFADIYINY